MEKLQPVNLIKDTQLIYLSTQSSSGTLLNGDYKSHIQYDLKNYISFENDDSIEYITCSVPYACLTNSNYNINETNNTLYVGYASDSSTFITYTFPVGNYSSTTLMSTFKTVLGEGWNIALDSLTKKFSISYTDDFLIGGASPINYIFGFNTTLYSMYGYNSVLNATTYFVSMNRVMNLLPVPRFIVRCDELNNGVMLSSSGNETSNILFSVPNVSKNNSLIVYENNIDEFLMKGVSLSTLTISITNENGSYLNFNGCSSYFVIRFNIYRKSITRPLKFSEILQNQTSIYNPSETEAPILSSPF
jgi:hypothetical protein